MLSDRKLPITLEINLLRAYLSTMEKLLEAEEQEYRTQQRIELEAEAKKYQEEIEKIYAQFDNQTEEEKEAAFNQALVEWENSWMDGSYTSSSDDDYYNSPHYELELTNHYLSALESIEFRFDFKNILRSSFFMHIYSLVETRLNRVCSEVKDKMEVPFSVSDLKYNGIQRAKSYLQKTTSIKIENLEGWAALADYNKIRNCIVHTRGILTSSKNDQYLKEKYIPHSRGSLEIDKQGKIIFDKSFCEEVIEVVEKFFSDIEAKLHQKINEATKPKST